MCPQGYSGFCKYSYVSPSLHLPQVSAVFFEAPVGFRGECAVGGTVQHLFIFLTFINLFQP